MNRNYLALIIILLLAFFLRTYNIIDAPPGLTHDEANHGRDSMNILDGTLLFYFPLNYGSEPLYNYVVAGIMALGGENILTLRIVNVFAGVLLVAAVYLWANWVYGRKTALIGAALVAVSFWAVATSRQALRAGLLPLLTITSVIFFWLMMYQAVTAEKSGSKSGVRWWTFAAFAVSVAATLHTYLAARVIWLLYPIFLIYLLIINRRLLKKIWLPTAIGLVAAGLMVVPMFAYVDAHPEAETRLEMLDGPLQNIVNGDLAPVFKNAWEALLAFTWPGYGDSFLAYNIPGRPLFGPVTASLFLLGIAVCIWRWREPAYAFLLLWFVVGIVPSLITGPTANTTRNMAALPAVYLLPVVGFAAIYQWLVARWGRPGRRFATTLALLWLLLTAGITLRDYFQRWADDPDVRAAYQQNLVQALDYLRTSAPDEPIVISSVYPGAAHDPSIGRVLLPEQAEDFRWIDGRFGLIFPDGSSALLIAPSSTPLHPSFNSLVTQVDDVFLKPDDLDPYFNVYELQSEFSEAADDLGNYGNGLRLLEARWLRDQTSPGETAELITTWEVLDPALVGPIVPPAFETDVVLFSHVLQDDGDILIQRDAIEVPSWDWKAGDIFVQIHPLSVPVEIEPGTYSTVVGVYDRASGTRLEVLDKNGNSTGTALSVVPLTVR